ncbi:uncharacterized protein LOC131624127 [Vicia villosa]|uniref:uncharacterized protein LOC131624127 n=1 Tax=Vicia villosa TaxID=3911 RepID=UPI00273B719E|nr:uncharacterized protein LOC131624127 [Vicia villosa]
MDNISFNTRDCVDQWKYVYQRIFALERELGKEAIEYSDMMELIAHAILMKTVTKFGKCYESLVKEFIVNIPIDCDDSTSKEFKKVYLGRNEEDQDDLEATNNQICQIMTANQVSTWPVKHKLTTSKLSVKYAILLIIGTTNWAPTANSYVVFVGLGKFIYVVGRKKVLDYGSYIFNQTVKHVGTCAIKRPIAFPSLLCGIIISQHPGVLRDTYTVSKRESSLSFHSKLFTGKHVPDIVMTSVHCVTKSSSKAAMICELMEACKYLDDIIQESAQADNNDEDDGTDGGGSYHEEGIARTDGAHGDTSSRTSYD